MAHKFEHVNHAEGVIAYVEDRIRIANDDGRLCAGIADEINATGKIREIFGVAHIAMNEGDAMLREAVEIGFTAATHEIVHDDDAVALIAQAHGKL
jgi:hypothetical protein